MPFHSYPFLLPQRKGEKKPITISERRKESKKNEYGMKKTPDIEERDKQDDEDGRSKSKKLR